MANDITIKLTDLTEIGQNVLAAKVDGKFVIVFDPTRDLGLSKSGLMRTVAQTSGFVSLPDGLRANLYVGKRA